MLIATHNLMQGLKLPALMGHYRGLRTDRGLDVLCVQENRCIAGETHSAQIAAALGAEYVDLSDTSCCGKGIIYNRERLRCTSHELRELPQLDRLDWLERRYIAGGKPDQRYVQIARFEQDGGENLTIINFHLDTAGGNRHRRLQVAAIAEILGKEHTRVVACGDTNAFRFRRRRQHELLQWLMEPLAELGVQVAPGFGPTHFFARQDEPKFTHQVMMRMGQLGFDWPLRYDVVCTNVEVLERGITETRESDHDLVWARLHPGN